MGACVTDRVARIMMAKGFPVLGSCILILGATLKENCPDLRNSKIFNVIKTLYEYNVIIDG